MFHSRFLLLCGLIFGLTALTLVGSSAQSASDFGLRDAISNTSTGLRPALSSPIVPLAGHIRPEVTSPQSPISSTNSAAAVLLHTTLDDAAAITNPLAGIGGATSLGTTDFATGHTGNGAQFVGEAQGKYVSFPTVSESTQNVELDRGEIEFWYRPNYDAAADDVTHALVVTGYIYNVPRLSVMEGDRLSLSLTDAGWNNYTTEAGYRAPLWTAGEWVHIRAVWDTSHATDSLRLYVNGARVDGSGVAGGWNLGDEADIPSIFVGSGNTGGDFIADGVIDELIIRDTPQAPATVTPTATPTITPTATGTIEGGQPTATLTATPTASLTPTPTTTQTSNGVGITDPNLVVTPATMPLQPVGVPFVDTVFGTTLRRVSDISDSGGFETQIYSQLQALSSDNVYLLLTGSNGYIVRRVVDLSPVSGLDTSGWNVPRWHPTQPRTIIHFDTNADTVVRLQFTNVDTGVTTTVFTFPAQYERIRGNQSFDEVSEDGHWLAGMVTRDDGDQVLFAFDIQNVVLGAQLALHGLYTSACAPDPTWGEVEPDWVGVSPLGNYMVVQWKRDGTTRCSGLETFDPQTGAFVGRVYDGHQHGDLGVDSDGVTEFFMTFELAAPPPNNDRPAIGVRQLPGTSTVSPPTYVQVIDWGSGEHISCQGPDGVCLVTGGTWDINGWGPFEGELFLQYTDGRVLRLVHHRSSSCGYWVQPRASISRDGRYVVFASDWGRRLDCPPPEEQYGRGDPYIMDLLADTSTPTSTATSTATGSETVTPTATPTTTPTATSTRTVVPTTPCDADFNHNNVIDAADLQTVAGWWHQDSFPAEANVYRDDVVDILDVMVMVASWGDPCSYLVNPTADPGQLDLYPKVGMLTGPALDTSWVQSFQDWGADFNGDLHDGTFRGAYAGEGQNPGWLPRLERKPLRE